MKRLIIALTALAALAAPNIANACTVHGSTYGVIQGPTPGQVTTNLRIDNSATGRANCKLAKKVIYTFGNWTPPRHAMIDGNYWRNIPRGHGSDSRHENPYRISFAWNYWHGDRYWVKWEGYS